MEKHLENEYAHDHGTVSSYIVGFILSILLTIVPYAIVTKHIFSTTTTFIAISILALLQLFVQLVYFLHLGKESKPKWNMLAFAFTVIVVAILVVGSLWIMYNLDYNMMH